MRTIEEIRRSRLAQLKEEFGSYVKILERLGLDVRDSTLSQIASEKTSKDMGSDLARRLEVACEKEPGWMDNDPAFWPFTLVSHAKLVSLSPTDLGRVEMSVLTAAAMAGLDIEQTLAAA